MRIVQWHGWLLDGSGSNVYTARVTEQFRSDGHDVLLLCQERHPERYSFIDAFGTVSANGVAGLVESGVPSGPGRCVLLRPEIGSLLPVFVFDEYDHSRNGSADLRRLAGLVAAGRLDPQIDITASWRDAGGAIEALLDRRVNGKAVLRVD